MINKNQKQIKTEKVLDAEKARTDPDFADVESQAEKSIVVAINRVTKVVKGGKRMSFNAIVVVGNGNGKVGASLGKSNEVQGAIAKATSAARKEMMEFPIVSGTIPHEIEGRSGAGHVWMKPAVEGTGLISGGGMRAILEVAGIKNILTKNLGSRNPFNTIYATLDALKRLKRKEEVAEIRK
ncbi:MAG: 30S ribosomal protein S5 [Elusimicrobia bacterium CG08_land_8_20_14_0_20_51_18]|nr:MAG: 30S ribosomal protein S5 [Elusimicrobia bacterium CG08_land_8_20_14_0_20_51_18]